MQQTLKKLYEYETMDRAAATDLLLHLTSGNCNETEIAAFLSIFKMRNITVDELHGFRDAMMANCVTMDTKGVAVLDIVGTGGDGKNTFNISTTAAMVLAGAGVKVAKHGNFSASSISGSSDVLQYLGYNFTNDSNILNRQLDEANICFLHAPLFHGAMKNVSASRKNFGLRTLFNILGPLTNPANPVFQILGVSHISLIKLYQYLLQETTQQYSILCALDGYDEISLTGAFKVVTNQQEQVLQPSDIGMKTIVAKELTGGSSVKDAADTMLQILRGRGTAAQQQVVVANSAFALQCVHPHISLPDCIATATEAILSGSAYTSLKKMIEIKK